MEKVETNKRRFLSGSAGKWLAGALVVKIAVGLIVLAVLYYPVGMAVVHRVDDNPDFHQDATVEAGASRAVAVAVALIDREVDGHRWVANDPFFLPGSVLDNMPNYQQGIVYALSRFAIEMSDQIGRTRGSSQVDPDLDKAAGLLKYAGNVWYFDLSTSLMPTASSEAQYRAARRSLASYNTRLAEGGATFERRADNLIGTLDRIGADLGSASAIIDSHVAENAGGALDMLADDIFYANKGRLYGYYLLLRELGSDYAPVIDEKQLGPAWTQLLESMRAAAVLQPWVVVNGDPESQFIPAHLTAQGFYLLRARTRLKEVGNILLK